MSAKQPFSYHVNKSLTPQIKSVESLLITLERAQKLDLLLHLISNLRQSLVICGPIGIGKTTLLNELKVRKKDDWPMLSIQATSSLSFESIQNQLVQFFTQNYTGFENLDISSIFALLDKQNQNIVVLIIDDAGLLVPGLITTLIQYAAANINLRVVFALTHDELHIKNSSDRAIDSCHFIEIPPLTEKQCGTFLQNLSAQPNAVVSFNAINEQMIEKVYQDTHGIPGNIVAELPKLSNYSEVGNYKWVGVALIAAIIAVGTSYLISDRPDVELDQEKIKTPLLLQQSEKPDISSPVVYSSVKEKLKTVVIAQADDIPVAIEPLAADSVEKVKDLSTAQKIVQKQGLVQQVQPQVLSDISQPVIENTLVENKAIVKTEGVNIVETASEKLNAEQKNKKPTLKEIDNVEIKEVKPKTPVTAEKDDIQWVLKQSEKNYTIQLMVLSTRAAVDELFRDNPRLQEQLKFFRITKQGKQKYVVIYGSFKNAAIASKEMKSLPTKYRKSWIRRFIDLKKK